MVCPRGSGGLYWSHAVSSSFPAAVICLTVPTTAPDIPDQSAWISVPERPLRSLQQSLSPSSSVQAAKAGLRRILSHLPPSPSGSALTVVYLASHRGIQPEQSNRLHLFLQLSPSSQWSLGPPLDFGCLEVMVGTGPQSSAVLQLMGEQLSAQQNTQEQNGDAGGKVGLLEECRSS